MKTTIYCPDIICESCIKILERAFAKKDGINNTHFTTEKIDIDFDETKITVDELIKTVQEKGYRAAVTPFHNGRTFKDRCKEFFSYHEKFAVEYKILSYAIISFILLLFVELSAYYGIFQQDKNIFNAYGWWIFYLNIAVVSLTTGIWHFNAYRAKITCMIGMMLGMTMGMQTGLILGTIIGATNGMFLGSVVGMLTGVLVGAWNGKCCGIMGVMEGMMAGVMGGTMGPMIAVMMKYDNIFLFMPLFMFVNILILAGLSYMLFKEVVEENPHVEKRPVNFFTFFSYCLFAATLLIIIIIYGYKSALAIHV